MNSEEMLDLLRMEYSKGRYDTITETVEWLSGFDEWGLQHITPEELVEDFKKSNGRRITMTQICVTMILCSVLNGLIIGAFIMGKSDNYKRNE